MVSVVQLKILQNIRRTNIPDIVWLGLLAFFTFLMARITVVYMPYHTDVGFLRIKQQYIDIDVWRTAFFIHVYASMWVLFAGFTQFSRTLMRTRPQLHRTLGYIYSIDLLFITGPAGLIMGFYANGGTPSRIAFVMLALLWMFFTVMAIIKAKQKDFIRHRQYMIRSYALTLSALTLRAWKYGITNTMHVPPMDVYRVVAWLGWVGNLAVAEYIIFKTRKKRILTTRDTK